MYSSEILGFLYATNTGLTLSLNSNVKMLSAVFLQIHLGSNSEGEEAREDKGKRIFKQTQSITASFFIKSMKLSSTFSRFTYLLISCLTNRNSEITYMSYQDFTNRDN